MNPSLRRPTAALLASSLLLTVGRGATLPFMTIYLTRRFGMDVESIGYALTLALTVGIVFSLGFGIFADKFDKKRYMLAAVAALSEEGLAWNREVRAYVRANGELVRGALAGFEGVGCERRRAVLAAGPELQHVSYPFRVRGTRDA